MSDKPDFPMSNKPDYLDTEMQCIYQYQISLSSLRTGVLGVCIPAIGAFISFATNPDLYVRAGTHLIILLIVFVTISMTASINRGIFVFGSHLKLIQEELRCSGFWTYWDVYLDHGGKRDSVTNAFVVALNTINLTSLYIFAWYVIHRNDYLASVPLKIVWCVLCIGSLLLFVRMALYIRTQADPTGFQKRIEDGLRKARERSRHLPNSTRHT